MGITHHRYLLLLYAKDKKNKGKDISLKNPIQILMCIFLLNLLIKVRCKCKHYALASLTQCIAFYFGA